MLSRYYKLIITFSFCLFVSSLVLIRVGSDQALSVPKLTAFAFNELTRRNSGPDVADYSCHHLKVGLQVGHWNNQHPPAELSWLVGNTGAYGGGLMEWESNHRIAVAAKQILEKHGIQVDLLEAVVPIRYQAAAFVSIHADGSDTNPSANGFKIAGPERDWSGRSKQLTESIRQKYAQVTKMPEDAHNITQNMTHYYSFSPDRFQHAIDSKTPATLLETGFLSNSGDQHFLIHHPEIPGEGLAQGLILFLDSQPGIDPCL